MTWDVAIVPQVHDWLLELRQDDPATLAAVSDALDLLGRDGPGLGPPLASPIASMTAIRAGLELLRECDPGFQFSADNVERTVAMSYLRELRPARTVQASRGSCSPSIRARRPSSWLRAPRRTTGPNGIPIASHSPTRGISSTCASGPRAAMPRPSLSSGAPARSPAAPLDAAASGPGSRPWEQMRSELGLFASEPARHRTHSEASAYASRLAELRKHGRITQQDLAETLGVSQSRVSQIERQGIDDTVLSTLAAYVEALGARILVVADFGEEQIVLQRD